MSVCEMTSVRIRYPTESREEIDSIDANTAHILYTTEASSPLLSATQSAHLKEIVLVVVFVISLVPASLI